MNKEELHMDKTVRDKLDSFAPEPPLAVWNNILGQLAERRRKTRIIYYRLVSAAAVVLLAMIGGWFFSERSEEIISKQVSVETTDKQRSQTDKPVNSAGDSQTDITLRTEEVISENLPAKDRFSRATMSGKDQTQQVPNLLISAPAVTERTVIKRIKGIPARWDINLPEQLVSRHTKLPSAVSESDHILIAENVKSLNRETEKDKAWIVGVQVAPGYSSHVADYGDTYSSQMTYPESNGNNSLGGGLSVRYKTGKKWNVESGIYYARNGQKSNNSPVFAAFDNQEFMSDEKSYFNTPVVVAMANTSDSRMTMNSTAGVVEFSGTPQGTELVANLDQAERYATILLTSGEFSQVFDLLEIPLYIRYSVVDSKFGLDIVGGLNAGVITGNNVYMKNHYGIQNIGKTKDISTVNFSGTLGVGLSWDISSHLSFSLEPRVNYYLNSINTNPEIDFHPYRIGLFTGFNYEF